jgi:hypothetical protein
MKGCIRGFLRNLRAGGGREAGGGVLPHSTQHRGAGVGHMVRRGCYGTRLGADRDSLTVLGDDRAPGLVVGAEPIEEGLQVRGEAVGVAGIHLVSAGAGALVPPLRTPEHQVDLGRRRQDGTAAETDRGSKRCPRRDAAIRHRAHWVPSIVRRGRRSRRGTQGHRPVSVRVAGRGVREGDPPSGPGRCRRGASRRGDDQEPRHQSRGAESETQRDMA